VHGSFLTHPELGMRLAIATRVALRWWGEEYAKGDDPEEFVMRELKGVYPTLHLTVGKPVFIDVRVVGRKRRHNESYTFQLRTIDSGSLILDPCR